MNNLITGFINNLESTFNILIEVVKILLNLLTTTNSDYFYLFLQILLVYILLQIFHETNILRLVLNILILLLLLSSILMIFQLELFACFLIVSEILLFSFIYAYLYNLNLSNKLQNSDLYIININSFILLFVSMCLLITNNSWNLLIINLNDLQSVSQKLLQVYTHIVFSDLIFLFNFFFIYNSFLYILLILILFIMTFVIIYTTFLVYLLNVNVTLYNIFYAIQIIDAPSFNATFFLKKKKKMKKLRIFKLN